MASNDTIPEAKVVLLGATLVGKTTLVTRFTSGEFDPSIKSTIGACYASKVVPVDKEKVKLQIWDTAGQEKFRTLVPMYFRGAKVAVLTFSVTDIDSSNEVEYWANTVKNSTSQQPFLFIVGNKIDAEDERKVTFEQGQKIAELVHGQYMEVSAKDGTNIEDLLNEIAKESLKAVKADAPQPKSTVIDGSKAKKSGGCC